MTALECLAFLVAMVGCSTYWVSRLVRGSQVALAWVMLPISLAGVILWTVLLVIALQSAGGSPTTG